MIHDEVRNVAREALMNALRHSQAKHIDIELEYTMDKFAVRILDDGIGIDDAILGRGGRPGHFGLAGMAERAEKIHGELTIRRRPEGGTLVLFRCRLMPT